MNNNEFSTDTIENNGWFFWMTTTAFGEALAAIGVFLHPELSFTNTLGVLLVGFVAFALVGFFVAATIVGSHRMMRQHCYAWRVSK